jgi:hypothetical protein
MHHMDNKITEAFSQPGANNSNNYGAINSQHPEYYQADDAYDRYVTTS